MHLRKVRGWKDFALPRFQALVHIEDYASVFVELRRSRIDHLLLHTDALSVACALFLYSIPCASNPKPQTLDPKPAPSEDTCAGQSDGG